MSTYTDQQFLIEILAAARTVKPPSPDQSPERWGNQIHDKVLKVLQDAGFRVATAVPYPSPESDLTLDFAADTKSQPSQRYAIDLVTEGAKSSLKDQLDLAAQNLARYHAPDVTARWAVGAGYSKTARETFSKYVEDHEDTSRWGEDVESGDSVSFIIIRVAEKPAPSLPIPPDGKAYEEGGFMPGVLSPTQGLLLWNPPGAAGALGLSTDVHRDYGASGSQATTKGSIIGKTNSLTLAHPLDFRPEQGIAVAGAGVGGGPLVTRIIGGAGTRRLTLADSAESTVTEAVVQHEESYAWQAAIDAAVPPAVITCPPGSRMNIAAPICLKSGVTLSFPDSILTWIGPAGPSIFTSRAGQPLSRSGIIGGIVRPGAAARVIDLHAPQECLIDLEVGDGTESLTVMRWSTDSGDGSQPLAFEAAGNLVRRLTVGRCGVLLALSGRQGAAVTRNLFQRLEGRDCRKAGILCEGTGYVDTNLFMESSFTLMADGSVGVDLGAGEAGAGISNLLFGALTVRNPEQHAGVKGLCLGKAAQVQLLAYHHPGLEPGSTVDAGSSASYHIRDMALDDSEQRMQDATRGWSVTPLQVGPRGTPVTNHLSAYQAVPLVSPVPKLTPLLTQVTLAGVRPGDTVVATPDTLLPPGLVWNCAVSAQGQLTLYLTNTTPADLPLPSDIRWRFDIWQH